MEVGAGETRAVYLRPGKVDKGSPSTAPSIDISGAGAFIRSSDRSTDTGSKSSLSSNDLIPNLRDRSVRFTLNAVDRMGKTTSPRSVDVELEALVLDVRSVEPTGLLDEECSFMLASNSDTDPADFAYKPACPFPAYATPWIPSAPSRVPTATAD